MKLVMTLLARNEADIVDAQIAFHLHAGVDFVIATDNGSTDGTTEILQRYARDGLLHYLREDADDWRQGKWVTRMARLAATEFGADWVINSDADEFWWPRGGTLKDVLSEIPSRFGLVRGCWRHFVPRHRDGQSFDELMTVRLGRPAFPGDKRTVYHAHQKVAHRASPDVIVETGNHDAVALGLEPLRSWYPLEVLHFSIRSPEQVAKKARGGWLRTPDDPPVEHIVRVASAQTPQQVDEFFEAHVVTDAELKRGLADGTYAVDTRVRDALRLLRASDGSFRLSPDSPVLEFGAADTADAAAYAGEVSVLAQIDGIVRAEARVAALEERLSGLRTLRPR
jgi:hypothetical protein